MKYKFSNSSRILINKEKVILGNRNTGDWIRTSKQVYNILILGVTQNISIEDLLKHLYDDEDREYIKKIYDNLCYLNIIDNGKNIEKPENKTVSFAITNRCNLKCTHCCMDSDDITSNESELTTDQIKDTLKKIIEWNPKRIMISGGEPMIRNDFFEILSFLKEHYNGKITLSTNGTYINDKNIDKLVNCLDQIDLSLDGIDEETCSIIRGKGVFKKVINSIDLLKNKQFDKITLSAVISDKNKYIRDPFISLSERLDVKPIIRGFYSIGRGKTNANNFLNKPINEYSTSDEIRANIGICNCSAMERELFIGANGDIYPCPTLIKPEYFLGNIIDLKQIVDLDIFRDENKADIFLDILGLDNFKDCIDCKVNLFCLSCPGTVYEIKDNEIDIKERCFKLKSALYKKIWEEIL